MAEVGNHSTTPDMDYSRGCGLVVVGLRVTMPEAASGVTSISFFGTTPTGADVRAAIYTDATPNVLLTSESAAYTTVASAQWHTINLTTTTLSNGANICLCLYDTSVSTLISQENGASIQARIADNYSNLFSGGAWQSSGTADPGNTSNADDNLEIYLTYTPAAGGPSNLTLLGVG